MTASISVPARAAGRISSRPASPASDRCSARNCASGPTASASGSSSRSTTAFMALTAANARDQHVARRQRPGRRGAGRSDLAGPDWSTSSPRSRRRSSSSSRSSRRWACWSPSATAGRSRGSPPSRSRVRCDLAVQVGRGVDRRVARRRDHPAGGDVRPGDRALWPGRVRRPSSSRPSGSRRRSRSWSRSCSRPRSSSRTRRPSRLSGSWCFFLPQLLAGLLPVDIAPFLPTSILSWALSPVVGAEMGLVTPIAWAVSFIALVGFASLADGPPGVLAAGLAALRRLAPGRLVRSGVSMSIRVRSFRRVSRSGDRRRRTRPKRGGLAMSRQPNEQPGQQRKGYRTRPRRTWQVTAGMVAIVAASILGPGSGVLAADPGQREFGDVSVFASAR